MAAFGSLSYGSGVEYYTQGAGGRAGGTNYYTGAAGGQEPPGVWSGKGAEALGLTGEVDGKAMEDLYSRGRAPDGSDFGARKVGERQARRNLAEALLREPDALPERIRQLERDAARSVREGRTFADFTFSLSKDLTVQHTAAAYSEEQARRTGNADGAAYWRQVRVTIEEAGYAGSAAAISYLNKHAGYVRTGRHGKGMTGRWAEAADWTVATFFQHTSREGDPQLHFHNPILLETRCTDGKVRKLDTQLMNINRAGAAAVGARVTLEMITSKLGWTFSARTDGNGHELDNVDQKTKDLFSDRTKNITEGVKKLVDDYVAAHGAEPNALVLTRLKKRVSLAQRPQKPGKDGETREQSMRRWDSELRAELGAGLGRQAAKSAVRPAPAPEAFSPSAVIAQAVARVQETKSTFTRSDLTRAIEAELPGYLGVGVDRVMDVIESLADTALKVCVQVTGTADYRLPADLTLNNGKSSFVRPGSEQFVSKDHIRAEQALQDATIERGRAAATEADADGWLKAHESMGMSGDQQNAVKGIMTSGAAVTALEGPAGTGKTFTLGGLSEAWKDVTGGRVIGLATSEQATEVLRSEGVQAKNIAQWLGAQRRIAEHRPMDVDQEWGVQPTDIIVPDEASMADTDRLAEIKGYVDAVGARLVLAGDPRQLAAVGSGGAMDLVVNTEGADKYKLTEVRRFKNSWEGEASLKLREGDATAIDQYAMHDRIREGGTAEQAMRTAAELYVGDRLAGKSSVVVTATNAQAAAVNGMVRDALIKAGRFDAEGVFLGRDGNHAGVGDVIKARKTEWTPGEELRNQGRYVVKEVGADGSLTVSEVDTGAVRHIRPAYVAENVELGYAGTTHSTQGATVDTAVTVVLEGQSLEGLYVGASRGRDRNTMIVVTEKEHLDPRTQASTRDQPIDAQGVIANIIEQDNEDGKAALTIQRDYAERSESMRTLADIHEESMREFVRQRTTHWLDKMATNGVISEGHRVRMATEKGTEQLGRLLRVVEQAGHDPEEVLKEAASSSLETASSISQVLHHRITTKYKSDLGLATERSVLPPVDAPADYQEHFEKLADMRRERETVLGQRQAEKPERWASDALGPVPEDTVERAEWEHRAGVIAAYREATGWNHDAEPVGSSPGFSKTEARAAWASAWEAAGRPNTRAEEHDLSEGALRNRVLAAQREAAAMPPDVFEEMRAVEEKLYESQQQAARAAAEADLAQDEFEAARLRELAAEHDSYAERWAAKRAGLQEVDDTRRALMDESAVTRELGKRAREELEDARGVEIGQEPDRCTAEEWLAREAEVRVEDDIHREISEVDLVENTMLPNERVEEQQTGLVAAVDDGLPESVPSDLGVAERVEKARQAVEVALDRRSTEKAHYESDVEVRETLPAPVAEQVYDDEYVWD